MKPVEERYNAWIDGSLSDEEAADLREELGVTPAERDGVRHLGGLLREHLAAPQLNNASFFNHQLMQQIASEAPPSAPAPTPAWRRYLLRLVIPAALSGAVAVFAIIGLTREIGPTYEPPYHAHLMETEAGEPGISAVAIQAGEEEMAVVWLDGLDYLPAEPNPSGR